MGVQEIIPVREQREPGVQYFIPTLASPADSGHDASNVVVEGSTPSGATEPENQVIADFS